MLAHDARDRHWQMSARRGGARADARVTPFPIRNSNASARASASRLDQLGVPDESAPRRGKLNAASAPMVEPRTERLLQPVHALRQAGWVMFMASAA